MLGNCQGLLCKEVVNWAQMRLRDGHHLAPKAPFIKLPQTQNPQTLPQHFLLRDPVGSALHHSCKSSANAESEEAPTTPGMPLNNRRNSSLCNPLYNPLLRSFDLIPALTVRNGQITKGLRVPPDSRLRTWDSGCSRSMQGVSWVAVKELELHYHNGYIYIYIYGYLFILDHRVSSI